MKKGFFLTFEGIDGCGKTTQITSLAKRLEIEGYPIVLTREPGGTAIAEKIRSIILDPEHAEMVSECELLLYLAARAQHVHEKIVPALQDDKIVLCDRFQEATYAYQGFGRGLSLEKLKVLNSFATGGLSPDLTIIFDIPVELSRERLKAMGKSSDRMESSPVSFYEKIRAGYQQIAVEEKNRVFLVAGDQPISTLKELVFERVHSMMKKVGC